jgi:hypothetical protein
MLKPTPRDLDFVRYARDASKISIDQMLINSLAAQSDARKDLDQALDKLRDVAEDYARATGVAYALQLIREYGALGMGKAGR